jgi:hypothetical protein
MKPRFPFPRIPIHPHLRPSPSSMITLTRLQLLLGCRLCLLSQVLVWRCHPHRWLPHRLSHLLHQRPGPSRPTHRCFSHLQRWLALLASGQARYRHQSPGAAVSCPHGWSPRRIVTNNTTTWATCSTFCSPRRPWNNGPCWSFLQAGVLPSPAYCYCSSASSDDCPCTPIPVGAVPINPVVNHHRMTTRGKSGLRFPALFEASTLSPIPRTYRAALTNPNWRSAMEQEYSALIGNHPWDLLPHPPHCNVVTGKWVFKHKFKADGSLERYKARWVLRGFTQRPGIDFSETFSPVVKPATVRTVLSLALSHSWLIHQLDVNNAFLQGTLLETVYCVQPTGFEDSTHPDYVCRLNRSLYGLKQAPRAWYSRFASHLIQLGFVEAKSDTSFFVYHKGATMIYLLYVDDIVLTASSMSLLRCTISTLQQEFSLKDLGPLHHFLGMHVQHSASGIFLSQRQYMIEILERVGMSGCKPCTTPVDINPKLSADGDPV